MKGAWMWIFDWWNIDAEELQRQVTNYNSRGAARKVSAYLLLVPVVVGSSYELWLWLYSSIAFSKWRYGFILTMIYLVLIFPIYKGWKHTLAFTMVLFTLDKAYGIVNDAVRDINERANSIFGVMFGLFWWSLNMYFLYKAYRVEKLREEMSVTPSATFTT